MSASEKESSRRDNTLSTLSITDNTKFLLMILVMVVDCSFSGGKIKTSNWNWTKYAKDAPPCKLGVQILIKNCYGSSLCRE